MNCIDVANMVVSTKAAHGFRGEPGSYEAKPWHTIPDLVRSLEEAEEFDGETENQQNIGGWILLDLFTASAIVGVAAGLSKPENRAHLATLPIPHAAGVCFQVIEKVNGGRP